MSHAALASCITARSVARLGDNSIFSDSFGVDLNEG
jgi:hypothetical protein